MTSDSAMQSVAGLLASQLAAFLTLLLAASAVHKGLRFAYTQRVAHEFANVPPAAAAGAVLAVMLGELSAGILLAVPASRPLGGLLAASIWGGYLALIVRAIAAGRRDVDCGCSFGTGRTRHPLGAFEVVRNALLVISALFAAGAAARVPAPVAASQALAALALLALYGALDQVMMLQPLRRGAIS
jgi:Methylamine utilisation protein MauE